MLKYKNIWACSILVEHRYGIAKEGVRFPSGPQDSVIFISSNI